MAWLFGERFFELRFESIGGLGAHAAGQILATAAVLRWISTRRTSPRSDWRSKDCSCDRSCASGRRIDSFARARRWRRRMASSCFTPRWCAIRSPLPGCGQLARSSTTRLPGRCRRVWPRCRVPRALSGSTRSASPCRRSHGRCRAARDAQRAFPFFDRDVLLDVLSEEFAGNIRRRSLDARAFHRGASEYQFRRESARSTAICRSRVPNPSGDTTPNRSAA